MGAAYKSMLPFKIYIFFKNTFNHFSESLPRREGQKRTGRITGLPFCEEGCAQLRCFSCKMKLFMAEFCVRIESRSGLRE